MHLELERTHLIATNFDIFATDTFLVTFTFAMLLNIRTLFLEHELQ